MEKEKYTESQVIEFTINILSNISVPAAMVESIGVPISKALGNLLALMQAKKEVKEDGCKTDSE